MNLSQILSDEIFPRVEKPSRYLGTEVNSVHKERSSINVRLALCFPDLYDLGLGNLGLHILYHLLNQLDGVWAERAYAPGLDLEALLRARGLPLFAVESRDPLGDFDGIGFTLQSELTYTNILNLLDLAGLPLRAAARGPGHPLVFAGGPAVFNPEPLAPFMDFFVIGDGEEIVIEIAEIFQRLRDRDARLDALERLPGIYVPSRYPFDTLPDGRIVPALGAPPITKRTTPRLDGRSFPVNYIVPFTEQVHDRVSLEVLRGCTQGCRFCQAGMTTRPVRERTIDEVDTLMERVLEATGYEEVSLVSLSTCDHSEVRKLVERTVSRARDQRVAVSLPSLRLDSFSVELADMVADTRRTGLTFAPEAASPRLRALINKWIPDEGLITMSADAYARGWDHVKLYFMIGLPTERDEDIDAIADLCLRVLRAGRAHNRRAGVHTGVSTFVPKPFTPFQWAEQISWEETERRQRRLSDRLRRERSIRFGRHEPAETWIEGLISRSDRRAADLIEAAWRNGARFDAWREHVNPGAWKQAILDTGFSEHDALRARALDERLPWDHIDIHVPKSWFQADWERAMVLQHAPDCRAAKCHRCGVIDVLRPLCADMLRTNIEGRKAEKSWVRTPLEPPPDQEPRMRIRARIGRDGDSRHLSHLEWINTWARTLRRAGVPLAWSQGFHPQPRINFSAAVPVGESSEADWMDVVLRERRDLPMLERAILAKLPAGVRLHELLEVDVHAPSLMSSVVGVAWRIRSSRDPAELKSKIAALWSTPQWDVERRKPGRDGATGQVEVMDLRPLCTQLTAEEGAVYFETRSYGGRLARVRDLVQLLELEAAQIHKLRTWLRDNAPVAVA